MTMNTNIFKYTKGLKVMVVILLLSSAFLTSCDDDEENTKVVLNSFGPAGIKHGETVKFIGLNLDKVTAIVLPGAEISASQFVSKSSRLIELTIPQSAEAGKVILKTPDGDIETKTPLDFEVPVVISSITSEAKPGTNIIITGTLVNWIEEVTFNDGVTTTEFVSKSTTEVIVKVPMEAQTGFLIFATGGTEPLTFASDEPLTVTVPTVASISPASIRHANNLTITGTNLDLITSVMFTGDAEANVFVSQSETEIVVAVPGQAEKGKITLKQASPIDIVTADEVTIILPLGTDVTPKPVKPGIENITITGTDLDLVASLTFPTIEAIPAASFLSQTGTQIVVAVPLGTKSGGIEYTTIHGYVGNLGANVVVPGPGPKPLAITMYDEQFFFGGQDWSWGAASSNAASTEQFFAGEKSWKHVTAGGDGGAKAGNMTGVNATSMGVYVFSLFGGPGTDGKQVAAILGSDGGDKWDSYNSVTLVEGEWTEYRLDLATSYPTVNLANISIFLFKVEGATNATLYVDRVGFDPAGPPPLDYYIFDDELKNGWAEWDGWGHSEKDFASTAEVFKGDKAIKVTFSDQYGAIQFGSPATNVFAGYTTLSFRVYAPVAQQFIVQLNDEGDTNLNIPMGWSEVEIPIADMAGNDDVGELRLKNNNPLPITLYFDEIGLKN